MKKLIFIIFIFLFALYLFNYKKAQETGSANPLKLATGETDRISRAKRLGVNIVKGKQLFAAQPLEIPFSKTKTFLDPSQILAWTNKHRQKENLKSLRFDNTLNAVAQAKVNDMFEQDYFAHVSPDGIGPAALAEEYEYEYILVGENLAKGNFGTDQKLVQAWMDSPGHRANILKPGYREIGIAVGQTTDNGQEVWLAVQSFGTPKSLCEQPDEYEREEIENEQEEIKELALELETRKEEISELQEEVFRGNESYDYLKKETSYFNELVKEHNQRGSEMNKRAKEFDEKVRKFNNCVKKY